MIARSLPFSFRNVLDRAGVAPMQRRGRRWQRVIAALEDWWTTSYLAWRGKIRRMSTLNGSADFAEIAMMIPRTMALMSSALAGTPKYTAADIAGGRV